MVQHSTMPSASPLNHLDSRNSLRRPPRRLSSSSTIRRPFTCRSSRCGFPPLEREPPRNAVNPRVASLHKPPTTRGVVSVRRRTPARTNSTTLPLSSSVNSLSELSDAQDTTQITEVCKFPRKSSASVSFCTAQRRSRKKTTSVKGTFCSTTSRPALHCRGRPPPVQCAKRPLGKIDRSPMLRAVGKVLLSLSQEHSIA